VDDLILAALQDRIAPADAARLAAWRDAAPENERHYQVMQALWHASAQPDRHEPLGDVPTIAHLVREERRGRRRVPGPGGDVGHEWSTQLRSHWLPSVVTIAAALVIGVLAFRGARAPAPVTASSAEFVTDTAETATARLDDGSVVRLAPGSRLRFVHAADARESWLDGEAYFAVAKDRARPFRVRTRAGTVEVLGTRFDLRVEADELRLIVTEGRVALQTANGRRELVANEVGTVNAAGTISVTTVGDTGPLLPWTRGFLVFQDTPLRLAAKDLERAFGVKVLLPDSALAERTITAWFTQQDLSQTLAAICRAVQAHCTLADGVASIEP